MTTDVKSEPNTSSVEAIPVSPIAAGYGSTDYDDDVVEHLPTIETIYLPIYVGDVSQIRESHSDGQIGESPSFISPSVIEGGEVPKKRRKSRTSVGSQSPRETLEVIVEDDHHISPVVLNSWAFGSSDKGFWSNEIVSESILQDQLTPQFTQTYSFTLLGDSGIASNELSSVSSSTAINTSPGGTSLGLPSVASRGSMISNDPAIGGSLSRNLDVPNSKSESSARRFMNRIRSSGSGIMTPRQTETKNTRTMNKEKNTNTDKFEHIFARTY